MNVKWLGEWLVNCGMREHYVEAWGEDGPYTKRVSTPAVAAGNEYGKLYHCIVGFESLEEAQSYLGSLCDPFDPETHPDFRFERNVYGSQAYQDNWVEEEYSRMDDEERYHRGIR
jgi:hypothetical protein